MIENIVAHFPVVEQHLWQNYGKSCGEMAVTNVKQSIIQKGAAEHWGENGRIPVEEVANRVNSTLEKYPVNEECSVEKFGVNTKMFDANGESSVERFGVKEEKASKRVSRTGQRIIDLVISDPSITAEAMSARIGVSKRAVEKNIKKLRDRGILIHEGSDKTGYWRIIVKP